MRTLILVLVTIVLSSLNAVSQAQIPVPPPVTQPPPVLIQIPPEINQAPVLNCASVEWLNQQSESLLATISCYLNRQSVQTLKKLETQHKLTPVQLIEGRIQLLDKLARQNTVSHCK